MCGIIYRTIKLEGNMKYLFTELNDISREEVLSLLSDEEKRTVVGRQKAYIDLCFRLHHNSKFMTVIEGRVLGGLLYPENGNSQVWALAEKGSIDSDFRSLMRKLLKHARGDKSIKKITSSSLIGQFERAINKVHSRLSVVKNEGDADWEYLSEKDT